MMRRRCEARNTASSLLLFVTLLLGITTVSPLLTDAARLYSRVARGLRGGGDKSHPREGLLRSLQEDAEKEERWVTEDLMAEDQERWVTDPRPSRWVSREDISFHATKQPQTRVSPGALKVKPATAQPATAEPATAQPATASASAAEEVSAVCRGKEDVIRNCAANFLVTTGDWGMKTEASCAMGFFQSYCSLFCCEQLKTEKKAGEPVLVGPPAPLDPCAKKSDEIQNCAQNYLTCTGDYGMEPEDICSMDFFLSYCDRLCCEQRQRDSENRVQKAKPCCDYEELPGMRYDGEEAALTDTLEAAFAACDGDPSCSGVFYHGTSNLTDISVRGKYGVLKDGGRQLMDAQSTAVGSTLYAKGVCEQEVSCAREVGKKGAAGALTVGGGAGTPAAPTSPVAASGSFVGDCLPCSHYDSSMPSVAQGGKQLTAPQVQEVLDRHNELRKCAGSPPLKWSCALMCQAQKHANGCKYESSDSFHARIPAGENLATGTSATKSAWMWFSEYGSYGGGGFDGATGHYTAMTWKGSSELGCGFCPEGEGVYVCQYARSVPNVGNYTENVPVFAGSRANYTACGVDPDLAKGELQRFAGWGFQSAQKAVSRLI